MTISASDVVEAVTEAFICAGEGIPDGEEGLLAMYSLLYGDKYILVENEDFEELATDLQTVVDACKKASIKLREIATPGDWSISPQTIAQVMSVVHQIDSALAEVGEEQKIGTDKNPA